jgi:hypothetical protein
MCQDCGSLLFQNNILTQEQLERKKSTDNIYQIIGSVLYYFFLFIAVIIFGDFINNFSQKNNFILIFLMAGYIIVTAFFFLILIIYRYPSNLVFNLMIFFNLIIFGIINSNDKNTSLTVFFLIMNSFLLIAVYFYFKNRLTKNQLIDLLFYMVIGGNLWGLIINVKHIITVCQLRCDRPCNFCCVGTVLLNLLMIIIMVKYLNRNKNTNNLFYIVLINLFLFTEMILLFIMIYCNNSSDSKETINVFSAYVLQSILINAGLFLSVRRIKKYRHVLKVCIGLMILFIFFRIIIMNSDFLFQNILIIKTYILSGFILPIFSNVLSNYFIKKHELSRKLKNSDAS